MSNKHSFDSLSLFLSYPLRSFALLSTLCILSLITLLVMAFFSSITIDTQIENASHGKIQASILARSALSLVLGEFQNELVQTSQNNSRDAYGHQILIPMNTKNTLPSRTLASTMKQSQDSGGNNPSSKYNNLIKQSLRDKPFFPGSSLQASPVNTSIPSRERRSLDGAFWEKPRLIGDGSSGSHHFQDESELPDWILLTRSGLSSSPTLENAKDKSMQNPDYVLGRFAFNIYDVGGILDINCAGYPSVATNHINFSTIKSSLAGADLTQLPRLTQKKVDDFISWRHSASLHFFPKASDSPYLDYVNRFTSTNGFLRPWISSSQDSDQRFMSRQDLIRYLQSPNSPFPETVLPYLTTYSRDINQPSYSPNPNRPKVLSGNGGNDSFRLDDQVNPSFLQVTALSPFVRNNGSPAILGEPLVKQRFSLNRLIWLTYKGPSANRDVEEPDMKSAVNNGIIEDLIRQGTPENIQKYFGLSWNPGGYWTYDHGFNRGSGVQFILTLSEVAKQNREPDFFELLKAAIHVGSIAKAAMVYAPPSSANFYGMDLYYPLDIQTDTAILQIGANIIDQFDADGYPTQIRTLGNSMSGITCRGVENLPYLYAIKTKLMTSRLPSPLPLNNVAGSEDPWSNAASLTDTGLMVNLCQPLLWNPHDASGSGGNPKPTSFRIFADNANLNEDNLYINSARYITNYSLAQFGSGASANYFRSQNINRDLAKTPVTYVSSSSTTDPGACSWTSNNTEMLFTVGNTNMFREPTLLSRPGVPAASDLRLGVNHAIRAVFSSTAINSLFSQGGIQSVSEMSSGTPIPQIGFYMSQSPMRWVESRPGGTFNIVKISTYRYFGGGASLPIGSSTYRLQYKDVFGKWVTYDLKYGTDFGYVQAPITVPSTLPGDYTTAFTSYAQQGLYFPVFDPRSSRFGFSSALNMQSYPPRILDPYDSSNVIYQSMRSMTNSVSFYRNNSLPYTLPYISGWYPGTWINNNTINAFHMGLFSQNNPLIKNSWNGGTVSQYYTDPDGVARRASGAYVPYSGNSTATTSTGMAMFPTIGQNVASNQSQSRPIILNRPFRSVAELGYIYSGTPWKNLSFFTPESGDSALLDVFCINESDREDVLVAGKVNLNTRQKPVLKALFSNVEKDALNPFSSKLSEAEIDALATMLLSRTQSFEDKTKGPLQNIAEIVGRWDKPVAASQGGVDGQSSYVGFSADLSDLYGENKALANETSNNIQRFRETAIRALADVGTTRTWNFLIDLVAQSGSYASDSKDFAEFSVKGEVHYWIHVTLDRVTGKILDQQIEVVR